MEQGISALERAFEIARSGRAGSVTLIKKALKQEGYAVEQVQGRGLSRQLRAIIKTAREGKMPTGPKGEKRPADAIGARSEAIQQHAYAIWLEEGRIHGRDKEHWRQAELEIDQEVSSPSASKRTSPARTPGRPKPR
jgi:Protein of unknown function (DUF2934)